MPGQSAREKEAAERHSGRIYGEKRLRMPFRLQMPPERPESESEFDAGVEQSAQAHLIPGAFAPGDVAHGQLAAVDDGLVLR